MKRAGSLGQLRLSHHGDPFQAEGCPRHYNALFTHFTPKLRQVGFSTEEIQRETPRGSVFLLEHSPHGAESATEG